MLAIERLCVFDISSIIFRASGLGLTPIAEFFFLFFICFVHFMLVRVLSVDDV